MVDGDVDGDVAAGGAESVLGVEGACAHALDSIKPAIAVPSTIFFMIPPCGTRIHTDEIPFSSVWHVNV
jgi:hypothetical protein